MGKQGRTRKEGGEEAHGTRQLRARRPRKASRLAREAVSKVAGWGCMVHAMQGLNRLTNHHHNMGSRIESIQGVRESTPADGNTHMRLEGIHCSPRD